MYLELQGIRDMLHVYDTLYVPLDVIKFDDKLNFVKIPIAIILDPNTTQLHNKRKMSRIDTKTSPHKSARFKSSMKVKMLPH